MAANPRTCQMQGEYDNFKSWASARISGRSKVIEQEIFQRLNPPRNQSFHFISTVSGLCQVYVRFIGYVLLCKPIYQT
jgi:hypothetical protein